MRDHQKIQINKAGIKINAIATEPIFYLKFFKRNTGFVGLCKNFIIKFLDGKIVFGKVLTKDNITELLKYIPQQALISLIVTIGLLFYYVSKVLPIRFPILLSNQKIGDDNTRQKYIYFPYEANVIRYNNSIPLPFLPYRFDKDYLATSFRDDGFATSVLKHEGVSGFRALGWTSNYFLGYPLHFKLDGPNDVDAEKLLIATNASIPGYNPLNKYKNFYKDSIALKYAEESFKGNSHAINFSNQKDAVITQALVITQQNNKLVALLIPTSKTFAYIGKENAISIVYPIATLTKENRNSEQWKNTPIKNISGMIIAKKNGELISFAISAQSFIRGKINDFFPLIEKICKDNQVNLIAYLHTDDGGATGDYFKVAGKVSKYAPLWGHCFSSSVAFVKTNKVNEVVSKLNTLN